MSQKKMRKVAVRDEFFFYHIGDSSVKIIFPDNTRATVFRHRIAGMTPEKYDEEKKEKSSLSVITPAMVRGWILKELDFRKRRA